MKTRVKYQAKLITVAAATAANTVQEDTIELDSAYDEVTGVSVHEVNNGTITDDYWQIGLKDDDRVYHQLAHVHNFETTTAVGPQEKFKNINIPVKKDQLLTVQTKVPASPAGALKYEIVFRLERKEHEI